MATWSYLLRGFLPSWKFFDVAGTEFQLEARFGESEDTLGSWVNCLPPIQRKVTNLILNPKGNYLHACHNHLSHLNADILECDGPEDLQSRATYRIARNLVEYQLGALSLVRPPFIYQFRLLVSRYTRPDSIPEEALISTFHKATS